MHHTVRAKRMSVKTADATPFPAELRGFGSAKDHLHCMLRFRLWSPRHRTRALARARVATVPFLLSKRNVPRLPHRRSLVMALTKTTMGASVASWMLAVVLVSLLPGIQVGHARACWGVSPARMHANRRADG